MKKQMKSGFTLIELLVVVAIIAVIGAGVAVTYNNLDQRAKTAMEINDVGTLNKAIKHWSFLHDWALPNQLDCLVGTDGNLYSRTSARMASMTGASVGNGSRGLYAQGTFTFMAKKAPERVIDNLAQAGLDLVYYHLTDVTPANDSTFRPGEYVFMGESSVGASVDTSDTAATLEVSDSSYSAQQSAKASAAERLAALEAASDDITASFGDNGTGDAVTVTWGEGESATTETFNDADSYTAAVTAARRAANASLTADVLAFVYPGGGAGGDNPMGMNLTYEIISNCGLQPEDVASPDQQADAALAAGKRYWLVVFGLGRFATIYDGKAARVDMPAESKRYANDESIYSRYLVVVRVPVAEYNGMTGSTEAPQVAAVLSPQGLSVSALGDNYRNDVMRTNN